MEKIVEYCRIAEVSQQQFDMLDVQKEIDVVRQYNSVKICQICGYKHKYEGFCPAKGKTCSKCGGTNHFAKVCSFNVQQNTVNEISQDAHKSIKEDPNNIVLEKDSDVMSLQLGVFTVMEDLDLKEVSSWSEEIQVNSEIINFKLDSGAEISTLPLS